MVEAQMLAFPETAPGVDGTGVTLILSVCAVDEPQALSAVTVTLPLLVPAVDEMLLVVEAPLQPEGKVQVYELAPVTALTLYVFEVPEQSVVLPLIAPGCAGTAEFTVTASVCAELLPQLLLAVTLMVPPETPDVAVMELVVEEPLQPEGSVHA